MSNGLIAPFRFLLKGARVRFRLSDTTCFCYSTSTTGRVLCVARTNCGVDDSAVYHNCPAIVISSLRCQHALSLASRLIASVPLLHPLTYYHPLPLPRVLSLRQAVTPAPPSPAPAAMAFVIPLGRLAEELAIPAVVARRPLGADPSAQRLPCRRRCGCPQQPDVVATAASEGAAPSVTDAEKGDGGTGGGGGDGGGGGRGSGGDERVGAPRTPRLVIEYCPGCRWGLRARWMAQELLVRMTRQSRGRNRWMKGGRGRQADWRAHWERGRVTIDGGPG